MLALRPPRGSAQKEPLRQALPGPGRRGTPRPRLPGLLRAPGTRRRRRLLELGIRESRASATGAAGDVTGAAHCAGATGSLARGARETRRSAPTCRDPASNFAEV